MRFVKQGFCIGIFIIVALLFSVDALAQCAAPINTFPYVADFETTQQGWSSGGANSDWAWGTPAKPTINTAGSGSKCWIAGGLTTSFYGYSEDSWVESPCFDFTNLQHPFFACLINVESEYKFDGANLQYSIDQGTTWTNVGALNDATDCMNANWYNYNPVKYLQSISPVQDGWCGNSLANSTEGGTTCQGGHHGFPAGWVRVKHCMQNLAGKPKVIFRFTFGAGTTCNHFDGFAFDSVSISEAVANTGTLNYNCINSNTATFTGTAALPCTDAFAWNFGDPASGASNTAATASATHTFSGSGTYTVRLIISGGPCNAPDTITQTIHILSVSPTVQNVTCFGGNNGAINITTTGGTGIYNYSWTGGSTSQNQTGLTAGTYTVTVTSAQSCSATSSSTVTQPAAVTVTATPTGAGCNGGTSGAINTNVTGGTAPYTYSWGGGIATPNRTGLAAGTYAVTVTDSKGCTGTGTATVTQSAAITSNITTTNTTCGASTGSATLTVANGTAPYHFLWSNGATTQNLTSLAGNTYTVTITDAGGCTASASGTVAQTGAPTVTAIPTQITCNNANDGQVNITVNGGNPAYTYSWSNMPTTQNITNLAGGTYTVTVLDAQSCTATASAVIINPQPVVVTLTPQNETCFGNSNASINSNVIGGTPGFTYVWSNAATTANISGLAINTYSVTVSDQNHCTASASTTIAQPTQLTASAAATGASCFGQTNGTVTLTMGGGTNPDVFLWSNAATTQNLSAVGAATYTVTAMDANGCTVTASATVNQPTAIVFTGTPANAQCFGYTNGSITVTNPTGGVSPFTFAWNNNATTQSLTNIANGNYTITVTDASNCTATAVYTVGSPPAIIIDSTVTNVTCFGGADGSIALTATGGSGSGYTYLWGDNSTASTLANVGAGQYSVTVTDGNACTMGASFTVSQPANVTLTVSSIPQACLSEVDGSASVAANGGTPPYTYSWSNQGNTTSINNLSAGNYAVTVTDSHLCTYPDSVTVSILSAVIFTPSEVQPFCAPLADGSIAITGTSGGTPPYTYSMNGEQGGPSFTNLVAGSYVVIITDSRGCVVADSFNLQYQYSITVTTSPAVTINLGDSTELTATSNIFSGVVYNWTPVEGLGCSTCESTSAQPVRNTLYYVNVTDSNGCYANASVLVTVIPNYNLFIPNCFTPNGDGNNDYFEMFGNKKAIIYWEIKVFNRWGEKVFESNDINFGWDGSYKGRMQDPGVFVYEAKVVFLDDYTRTGIKGSITLLR